MNSKNDDISLEEFLLADTSALAICIYLNNHRDKIDLSTLQEDFGAAETVNSCLEKLIFFQAIEQTQTGKGRRPRLFLTDYGRNVIDTLIEASNAYRTERIKENNYSSIEGNVGSFKITTVTTEQEGLHGVDLLFAAQQFTIEIAGRSSPEKQPSNALIIDDKITMSTQKENKTLHSPSSIGLQVQYEQPSNEEHKKAGRNPWQR